ncbi:MAG: hypothetical protein A3J55_01905 [Candidatus Ryanbacteria bacterium RIFCSPHIGHO2_02_FULL_45_17b]|uniref:Uncharacterized protein n=1 Tax=Candidatus Ryanbacteria bacterium RIFCSPHIGHO2_01_FULL_45_22 TaxID=1802114 RepID=A0A1G2G3R7_9BACT|nr:MAG: hypothetical protein A2719_04160 [Candidatus Ryanbacteria bacterium RIFCSPHIGHO2_01_FULL_45_22]OGZ47654.1 MAG: hypothetical protein A3J55_01905 [Candidatus Ryanbacteria bacterium RIFCSPHIGHO2_02_FULL_45_17b]
MKKFMMAGLSVIMTGTFVFAPFVSMAQTDNMANVLAGLTQQIRVLQEIVSSLQARFAALGRSSMAQVGAGVIGVAESHATSSPDTTFVINDTTTSTFRLGAANPSRFYTQSFKAPMDGKLKQARFFVAAPQNGNPTKPITVSVHTTLTGSAITTETIIPALPVSKLMDIPTDVVVNFANPVTLQKDSTYYVRFSVAAPYDSKHYYRLLVGSRDPYKDGTFYYANGQKLAVYDMIMSVVIGSSVVTGGELKISPVQGLDKTVVAGSRNVLLAGFGVTVGNEPAVISKISLIPSVPLPSPSTVTNLSLYKTSGELIAGPFDIQNGILSFTDQFKLPIGTSTILVKGDVSAGTPSGTILGFGTNPSTDWHAKGEIYGVSIIASPNGIVSSVPMTVVHTGGWAVSLAPSAPPEKWVVAGSVNVPVNVLRFTATAEDFALTDMRLQLKGPATGADIAKISLWNGATKIAEKVPSFVNGVEDFTFQISGVNSFIIPKDSFKEMTIRIDVPGIDATLSGTAGRAVIIDFDGNGTPLGKNKAVGLSSANATHSSTLADTSSSGIRYFRSLPTVERVALPVTALTSGNQVLYKFKVTANPAYDVALHKFTFSVATTGITRMSAYPANITLWNTTENRRVGASGQVSDDIAKATYGSAGEYIRTIYADSTDLPSGQCTGAACWDIVPAGSVRTYELRANITTDGSGDSVSTKLLGDWNSISMGKASIVDVLGSQFIWSDFSANATTTHSINTADWMNGYKVPGLLSTGLDSSTLSN